MERLASYAGVTLDPFTTHDPGRTTRLEDVALEAPDTPEAWLVLARCHDDHGRTAQAVLAYVRYAMIEQGSASARAVASRVFKLLVPEFPSEPPTTAMRVPSVSGDPWWQAELILATIRSTRHAAKTRGASDERFVATALQGLVTFVVDLADAARMGELWRTEVVPYFRAARANCFLESMAYVVTGPLERPESTRWLARHAASVRSLRTWTRRWPSARSDFRSVSVRPGSSEWPVGKRPRTLGFFCPTR
ncbi:MAG TPA: tetratricopeptide repeat protein [Candidatus Polarisedimenticolaceae bacterium]|nr:tetratricopeptide repeat protein [Candidatus Polarisedimenticolaceae bacterium]